MVFGQSSYGILGHVICTAVPHMSDGHGIQRTQGHHKRSSHATVGPIPGLALEKNVSASLVGSKNQGLRGRVSAAMRQAHIVQHTARGHHCGFATTLSPSHAVGHHKQ